MKIFLTRKAFDKIINRLVPENRRSLSYELLEGCEAALPNVMERIATYSFEDLMVVGLKNAPLFPGPSSPKVAGFSVQEIDFFQEFIKKPFPDGHYLVLTTDTADKRRGLFKALKQTALLIDCSAPKGSRQADKNQQAAILRQTMEAVLDSTGKGIDGDAFALLVDYTGFDPATLSDNLEKLVFFIGKRITINVQDVQKVVKRTRKDAIFELTNSVAERNSAKAVFYLKSLLSGGFHPLQILMALGNQFRKLVLVKLFVEESRVKGTPCWQTGKPYNRFKQETMPMVEKADADILAMAETWDGVLAVPGESDQVDKKQAIKNKKKKIHTDLLIAPNKNNTFPVYHTFLKSDNFSLEELICAITELNEVDLKMKSSASDPELVLDNLILRLCTKE